MLIKNKIFSFRKRKYKVYLFALYEEAKVFLEKYNFTYATKGIYICGLPDSEDFNEIVLITGIGGINASNSINYLVHNFIGKNKIKEIKLINLGTCGSSSNSDMVFKFNVLSYLPLVNFEKEAPDYYINDGKVKVVEEVRDWFSDYTGEKRKVLHTYGSFVDNIEPLDDKDVFIDMEAYAIADFCYKNSFLNVTLDVYKVVSDNGNYDDFKSLLNKCSYNMCDFIEQNIYGKSE